jgi:hypothetical protein
VLDYSAKLYFVLTTTLSERITLASFLVLVSVILR